MFIDDEQTIDDVAYYIQGADEDDEDEEAESGLAEGDINEEKIDDDDYDE